MPIRFANRFRVAEPELEFPDSARNFSNIEFIAYYILRYRRLIIIQQLLAVFSSYYNICGYTWMEMDTNKVRLKIHVFQ